MVRLPSLVCTLAALMVSPLASADAGASPDADLIAVPRPTAPPGQVSKDMSAKPSNPAPALDWRARVAVAIERLQSADPAFLARLSGPLDALGPADLQDSRAAAVLLRRLLQGTDPPEVRRALAEALPQTGGDWQEGAAALIGLDASPDVRKQLVETMRYATPPHSVEGLRRGFKDEDPAVNIAAARTTGFSRDGGELFQELFSSTFDADWDLRAAAVQALGMLRLPRSRDLLIKALADEEREVRLQALLALEQLDPEGVIHLPQLEKLAKDRKSHRIARKAELMLRKRRAAEKAARSSRTIAREP